MFKHILIPTDGSDLSRKAILYGVQLAKESGAKVTWLTVDRALPRPGHGRGSRSRSTRGITKSGRAACRRGRWSR